jgi:Cu(I)/Ag(I) efflux system periplasmic protein CusF
MNDDRIDRSKSIDSKQEGVAMNAGMYAAVLAAALALQPAFAGGDQKKPQSSQPQAASSSAAMTEGEVRKVDKEAKKVTLKHGPISNLDMPAMTMVFQVSDPAMLDRVKAGDKVRFTAEKTGSGFAVTRIEK